MSSSSLSSITLSPSFPTSGKNQIICQQLIILIHAHKCLSEDKASGVPLQDQRPCSLPHCQEFKKILEHMEICRVFTKCEFNYCTSSREIIKHWKECKNASCPVCAPIRHQYRPYDPTKVVELRPDAPHYFYE